MAWHQIKKRYLLDPVAIQNNQYTLRLTTLYELEKEVRVLSFVETAFFNLQLHFGAASASTWANAASKVTHQN
jgi:hypothetical protein